MKKQEDELENIFSDLKSKATRKYAEYCYSFDEKANCFVFGVKKKD